LAGSRPNSAQTTSMARISKIERGFREKELMC
jgi:hypothetical protein